MVNSENVKNIIREQLPNIISEDPSIRDFILRTVSEYYSPKSQSDRQFAEFTERVDRILAELQRDREEQARKWDEQTLKWQQQDLQWEEQNRRWEEQSRQWEEQNRRWEEQSRQWEEQNHRWEEQRRQWEEQSRRWDQQEHKWQQQDLQWEQQERKWEEQHQLNQEILAEIKKLHRKHDSTIGALGSRWGLQSEATFRNALAAILEESFGVEVLNINDYDPEGMVFGRPDQVEIDVIIKNGLVIVCEIKSSMSKSDMYIFSRKVDFYQQKYDRHVNRKMVISPMVDNTALPVAENLGIEVYGYAEDVPIDN